MLALRMQRIGRSGHAQYRLIVQDSRFSPKSGRVVAYLGSYNPHTKAAVLDKEKAESYLKNGAQPSDRLARLLKKEGVKLPKWVELDTPKKRAIKNKEKLKKNRPKEAAKPQEKTAEEPEAGKTEEVPTESAPTPETSKNEESPEEAVANEKAPEETEAKSEDKTVEEKSEDQQT